MQITASANGSGTVLELNGKLVRRIDLVELRNAVRDAAGNHPSRIILNLANVTDANFDSIGELVNAFTHIKNLGGSLVLMNLPRRIRILLETAKLMRFFEVTDNDQALILNTGQRLPQRQLCF